MIDYNILNDRDKQIYMKAAMRALFHWVKIRKACEVLEIPYQSVLNWVCITKRVMGNERFKLIEGFYLPYIQHYGKRPYFLNDVDNKFMRYKERIENDD